VLGHFAILEAHDIRHDPVHRQADAAKPTVKQHVVAIGDHKPILVTEVIGESFDYVEESFGPARDMARLPEREYLAVAGIFAASLALSELFLSFASINIEATRRVVGISLWRPNLEERREPEQVAQAVGRQLGEPPRWRL
jgi:hypothetical protein